MKTHLSPRAPASRAVPTLFLVSTCAALVLAACGGSDGAPPIVLAAAAAAEAGAAPSPATVRLQGCVVDADWAPGAAVPIRALAADGRLIGQAQSNADGVFSLVVPARATIVLAVDRGSGDSLSVQTGQGDFSVGACLR